MTFQADVAIPVHVQAGSFTDSHHQTAPGAWDQVEQAEPAPQRPNSYNAITMAMQKATAVHRRSSNRLRINATYLMGSLTSGPFKLVDTQQGRRSIIIKCPPSNTKGCFIADNEDALLAQEPLGWLVSPGDPPIEIENEDAIWCIGQSGVVITDTVQTIVNIDSPDDEPNLPNPYG